MNYLLLYSSTDGQTKKIILKMAEQLRTLGGQCDIRDLNNDKNFNLSSYSKVIVGASIRYGHFNKALMNFTKTHQKQLNTLSSAFFGVNLTARKAGKDSAETNVYVRKFLEKTPWRPSMVGVFAGALFYPRYSWFDKKMIQLIMRMTDGETDTTKEVEYTDWNKVASFTQQFFDFKG
ncbi:menaquinone-dependent protoporphyrinogen IX dehydrogenase [Moellerella wisconsensis]|uniref:Protoporphyrinogen IX dehydrogenase [quinone] n=2 Tax=Moellerella wisconsensis TaxID=158849 RepID=A0A9Q8Q1N7_9GAMM|nr:menaquinone-dependent protoporphyrinogen IX dehydrogenase [Moellerella wisconsensis]KLN98224.1 protoporphyrinogen oxidase [Moellerella wisconsensis]UNH23804.1 menaquinone-dependent protoporphyrinogen IX dehydrogenase [Moellerella wisconsensis]UNH26892.1 menaquinone-dependent protoporphyrinogen IX dehydrogenase [Moellerella wisconsensis]UNH30376.1 menaquinone-dependent protoporphyrinogen IX dehydrogenase [Moellerella wisconsensis]UNH38535.1 menaquinone-dependent protoporphyrinogen IX dehydro